MNSLCPPTGTLTGFLFSEQGNVSADLLTGLLSISGATTTDLNVQSLTVSAQRPIMDATTFWQIQATTNEGMSVCAWSGGSGCGPGF